MKNRSTKYSVSYWQSFPRLALSYHNENVVDNFTEEALGKVNNVSQTTKRQSRRSTKVKYQSMGPHASISSRKSSHAPAIGGWRRSKVAPTKDAQCNSAVKQGEHHRSSTTSATGGQRGSSINHGQCDKRKSSGRWTPQQQASATSSWCTII
ncbi:hypothetical protein LSAT2_019784 [Lamellibrachia satsuma]|nr:hypothetical protein LSAT2_019784 [Lamellibrachia satsuma]